MSKLIASLATFGLMFGIASNTVLAQSAGQIPRIEQPSANKAIVTLGGLGLIGLELWWFLLSKPKSRV